MTLLKINKKDALTNSFALFEIGFRPFFLGAGIFALSSMIMWMLIYVFNFSLQTDPLSHSQWHSHEMIYGYSMAVIAGFLLTAVMNWTGIQTIHGKSLAALFSLWMIARILLSFGSYSLHVAAIFDLSFMIALIIATASPIIAARQWRQLVILSKLSLLTLGNCCFYLGALGYLENGVYWGLYGGLYLVISLILTIGGRVMPMFIKNGLNLEVDIRNPKWIAITNLVLFLFFTINQLFINNHLFLFFTSFVLFIINSLRLFMWHTPLIWSKPLLWGLYLSFVSINFGFLLYALSAFGLVSQFIAIHAFGIGGIGLATLSMMTRVSLGHSGRNIRTPARFTNISLILLTLGVLVRVVLPIITPSLYLFWIATSQALWIGAFMLFLAGYSKILIRVGL